MTQPMPTMMPDPREDAAAGMSREAPAFSPQVVDHPDMPGAVALTRADGSFSPPVAPQAMASIHPTGMASYAAQKRSAEQTDRASAQAQAARGMSPPPGVRPMTPQQGREAVAGLDREDARVRAQVEGIHTPQARLPITPAQSGAMRDLKRVDDQTQASDQRSREIDKMQLDAYLASKRDPAAGYPANPYNDPAVGYPANPYVYGATGQPQAVAPVGAVSASSASGTAAGGGVSPGGEAYRILPSTGPTMAAPMPAGAVSQNETVVPMSQAPAAPPPLDAQTAALVGNVRAAGGAPQTVTPGAPSAPAGPRVAAGFAPAPVQPQGAARPAASDSPELEQLRGTYAQEAAQAASAIRAGGRYGGGGRVSPEHDQKQGFTRNTEAGYSDDAMGRIDATETGTVGLPPRPEKPVYSITPQEVAATIQPPPEAKTPAQRDAWAKQAAASGLSVRDLQDRFGQAHAPPGMANANGESIDAYQSTVRSQIEKRNVDQQNAYGAASQSWHADAAARDERYSNESRLKSANAATDARYADDVTDAAQKVADLGEQGDAARLADAEQKAKDLATVQDKIDRAIADVGDGSVDPDHYIKSMTTGDKVMAGFAMILGGFAQGLHGGPNQGIKAFGDAVSRDIKAQEYNVANGHKKLSELGAVYKDVLGRTGSKTAAADAARDVGEAAILKKLRVAEAGAHSEKAKRGVQEAILSIEQKQAIRHAENGARQGGQTNTSYRTIPKQVSGGVDRMAQYRAALKAGAAVGKEARGEQLVDANIGKTQAEATGAQQKAAGSFVYIGDQKVAVRPDISQPLRDKLQERVQGLDLMQEDMKAINKMLATKGQNFNGQELQTRMETFLTHRNQANGEGITRTDDIIRNAEEFTRKSLGTEGQARAARDSLIEDAHRGAASLAKHYGAGIILPDGSIAPMQNFKLPSFEDTGGGYKPGEKR